MRILAIETATPLASAAVIDRSGLLAETVMRAPRHHLEWLLPAVNEMLDHLGTTSDSIEGLAVSWGPGGFTGLRIGIATAAGWAQARALPVIGIGTLEALARVPGVEGLVLPVLDAHRGEVAGALYRLDGSGAGECLVPPTVGSAPALAARVGTYPGPVLVIGDGLAKFGGVILAALGPRARTGGPQLHPRAAMVGMVALPRFLNGERTGLDALRPVYGRRPVAFPGKETPSRGGNPT
jgi:tRNA threonylcarbamoyladenosine biosynthesis protein TsaB